MTCPNCGKEYSSGSTCPFCNVDKVLYSGTVRISDVLYNKGLAKLKVSDLSGAMDALSKSVDINKNNTQARNLLGLVQYEVGYVGDAIKNWVISCGLQKENNPAATYMSAFQKNARAFERLKDAIRIYNQALNDIWQKSDDMAIIKLRQAVDLNPKFIDALNLLAFCYMIQKDKAKALAAVERVLELDKSNTTALNYYNELNPKSPLVKAKPPRWRPAASPAAEAPLSAPFKKVTLHERRNVNFHIEGILCLVIGVVCTLGVMFVLVNPALARVQENRVDDVQARLAQVEQAYDTLQEDKDEVIAVLESRINEYEDDVRAWEHRYDTLERNLQVLHAFELLREDRLREAVDALGGVDTDGLRADIAERAHEVRQIAYPQLAREYFGEGLRAYNALDFEKARVDFERAYRYAQHIDDPGLQGDIMYYLAWTFSRDFPGTDIERAIHYFERMIEEFPNHRYVRHAQNRMNSIMD